MSSLIARASRSIRRRWVHAHSNTRVRRINREVSEAFERIPGAAGRQPVVFFNASTRLAGLSLNAAYNLIARWAVQLAGVPVVGFACRNGMTRCVLGTNRDAPTALPPCAACIRQSEAVYAGSPARWFSFQAHGGLDQALTGKNLAELMAFTFESIPLGELALPSMRWVLRRHHLVDDANTRSLYSQYIRSAYQVICEFEDLLDQHHPQAVVVFNGMFYPEASARWLARRRGIRVISHEVGLRPYTVFFTEGDATAYPIDIPADFELSPEQDRRLDEYLEKRMQGNFSMAGVRFWPEMRRLDDDFVARLALFRQVVPVFTNVIFDTSQPHSNVVFPHMFAWLEQVAEIARSQPDTLFVIRAHPDEARPGKESRESVADWVRQSQVTALPNVVFVPPQEYLSSYELIQRSKFVMVYNSTIGLEAALMGAPVLCGGRARFTQIPTVFFQPDPQAYRQQAEAFLSADHIDVPAAFRRNARRFLYYQLFRTSLPFDSFIQEDGVWQGYVRIKDLDHSAFDPQNSPILKTVVEGILEGKAFLLDD